MDPRKKAVWGLAGLVALGAGFALASYFFDLAKHRAVVEMRPEAPDIPGGSLYDITVLASEEGKKFVKVREMRTRRVTEAAYDLEVILNDESFFRAMAAALGKGPWEADDLFRTYRARYDFDRKVVFTVMMHSAMGHLFDYRPESWIVLRLDGGREYTPADWKESNRSMEFHRLGVATFASPDGAPILGPGVKKIELALRDPSGRSETVLQWDLAAL